MKLRGIHRANKPLCGLFSRHYCISAAARRQYAAEQTGRTVRQTGSIKGGSGLKLQNFKRLIGWLGGTALVLLVLAKCVSNGTAALILAVLALALVTALTLLHLRYWRCPHCGQYLGRTGCAEYCPHCGKRLDDTPEKP